ncbi:MAG: ribosomal protein S7, partial [Myxococcota bacterium]
MSYRDHWKLPDAVPDDWAARRRLAHALRQISERCVTTDAPTESMVLAAELVEAALARLPPGRTSA